MTCCLQFDPEPKLVIDHVTENSVPLVGELTEKNIKKRYAIKRPAVIFFFTVDFSIHHRKGENPINV